jgi:hypothetical protein
MGKKLGLDVSWENAPDRPNGIYRVRCPQSGEHGAISDQEIIRGEPSMREYLSGVMSPEVPPERRHYWTNQWLLELHSTGRLNLTF